MNFVRFLPALLLIAGLFLCIAPVSAVLPGGGLEVLFQCPDSVASSSCNANGATVYVNDAAKGTIADGIFAIPYEDGFSLYKISRSGYYDKTGTIPEPARASPRISPSMQHSPRYPPATARAGSRSTVMLMAHRLHSMGQTKVP